MGTLRPARLEPEEPLAGCRLFDGLSPGQRAKVASLMTERVLAPGTVLMREGDEAAELYVIRDGAVEVTKRGAAGRRDQRIATLSEGATLGEMTLVDRAPRSASARAVAPTRVGVVSMDDLARLAETDPGIEARMLRNLSGLLSQRLRLTNETTVAALERQLELERVRSVMGRFVVTLSFLMVTYTFALAIATEFLPDDLSVSAVSLPLILLFAGALYRMMRLSEAPFESFGVTLREWRPAVLEALVWTLPMCALATLAKLGLIWASPAFAEERLFNLSGLLDPRTTWSALRASLLLALLYAAAVPLQEFIVRVGLQTSLRGFLDGPSATLRAIVISNALFASSHMHLSLSFAVLAFLPGLVWGALYARQGNLIGVSVSHALCGWFAFLVLGFEPWY